MNGRQLHLVVGRGGRARERAAAVRAVTSAAEGAGWALEHLALSELTAAADDITRLAVIGGDGLVHRCLPLLVEHEIDVALVPVGSGNDFARALGIDDDTAIAAVAAVPDEVPDEARSDGASPATAVDVIEVAIDDDRGAAARSDRNGSSRSMFLAASVVTAGFSGRVNALANRMRFPFGAAKYSVAALREMGRLRPTPTTITLTAADGTATTIDDELTMFAVGNTAYFGGGMRICPTADPTDGQLDVVTLGAIGTLEFARWLPRVFTGAHTDHRAVGEHRATTVTIETTEVLWADGEPLVDATSRANLRPDSQPGVAPGTARDGHRDGDGDDDGDATVRRATITVRPGALHLLGLAPDPATDRS